MVSRLPLAFVLALCSGALVSCLAGSDDDEASPNNAGSGGAAAGGSTSGGAGGATGGSAGSGTGGATTGGSSGSGTGGNAMGGTGGGSGTGGSTGGSDSGGSAGRGGSTGGTGGGDAGSGGSTAGTGGVACCLAIPVCDEDETEVSGPDACPPSATCRELTLCCSTIWCSTSDGSAGMGGKGGNAGDCNPADEHDREYVADSPAECAVILYACPDHTEAFSNDCGCGCEQDADCPEFVDCMPGPEPRPGCSAEERARCPYTDVAF